MTEIADRYRRLSEQFARRIAAVQPDGWSEPTPCAGWTVADLVAHVVQTQGMFRGFVGRQTPEVDVADDPAGAWRIASSLVQSDLDDPALAAETFVGMAGEQTFEEAVDRFLDFDLVVHGWDLAHATGQDEAIAEEDLRRVDTAAREMEEVYGDAMRGPQGFGPEVPVGPEASEQEGLLAFLGRRA
jgi:uncharacterized protein (TIGR03086 family)